MEPQNIEMKNHLATYRTYQQRLIELQQAAVNWGLNHRQELHRTARKLGMLSGDGTLIFDEESDMSILMDGLIYEEKIQQRKVVTAFLSGYVHRDEIDHLLTGAMLKARFGLYQIESTAPECAEIKLKALTGEAVDTTLINIGLSESAKPGLIIAIRILFFPEFSMSSGVFFLLPPGKNNVCSANGGKRKG